jgi:chemotaxis protein methyltransferase CheR
LVDEVNVETTQGDHKLPTWVFEAAGTDFAGYEQAVLAQRLYGYLAAAGEGEAAALRVGVTRVQVVLASSETGFFSEPEFWMRLRLHVIPRLRTYPSLRIWVPGCATGLSAYAVAITLEQEGLLDRAQVFATELLEGPLSRARHGLYRADDIERAESDFRQAGGSGSLTSHFLPKTADSCAIVERLRSRVYFAQYNIATDASFNEFQLIVCRGLLSSLEEWLRRRAVRLFRESLCRNGFLALGSGEHLSVRDWAGFCEVTGARELLRKGVPGPC